MLKVFQGRLFKGKVRIIRCIVLWFIILIFKRFVTNWSQGITMGRGTTAGRSRHGQYDRIPLNRQKVKMSYI